MLLVRLAAGEGLSSLPLVGPQIPPDVDVRMEGVALAYASRALSPQETDRFNETLGRLASESSLTLPPGATPQGARVGVDMTLGSSRQWLLVPLSRGASRENAAAVGAVVAAGDAPRAGTWLEVARSLGPVRVDRVGVAYQDGAVWLLTDAALDAGGIRLGASGLGLGVPLQDPGAVQTRLDGASLEFSRPPVELGGALVRQQLDGYDLMLKGMAVVELPQLSLTAIGAYAKPSGGEPSLFLFGELGLARPVGPPMFQVSKLMAGFGYNSSVRLPVREEMDAFPLMSGSAQGQSPMEVLTELTDGGWVSPAAGRIWIAAGAEFDTFKLVHTRALLLCEFGDSDFTVGLLGRSLAQFPKQAARPYARVELLLQAVYRHAERALKIDAQLAPSSYLIDPSCQLTGGAAFYAWFDGSEHAGDFVLTVGGYHPSYKPAAHYPQQIPRLGFYWNLGGGAELKGESYFALTPAAIMAGGKLDLSYRNGGLHAWLTAFADLLIQWAPFMFDVSIGVSVGVTYTLDLGLFKVPISARIGASLHLWGPPTGGRITVHVGPFDITIPIGASGGARGRTLDWDEFRSTLLPQEIVQLTVVGGLRASNQGDAPPGEDDPWLVSTDGFSFTTTSALPLSTAQLTGQDSHDSAHQDLDIRPMACRDARVAQSVTVAGADGQPPAGIEAWSVEDLTSGVPQALWGAPVSGMALPSAQGQVLPGRLTGLRITVPAPTTVGHETGWLVPEALAYEDMTPVKLPWAQPVLRQTRPLPRPVRLTPGHAPYRREAADQSTQWARRMLHAAFDRLEAAPGVLQELQGDDEVVPFNPDETQKPDIIPVPDPNQPDAGIAPPEVGQRVYVRTAQRIAALDDFAPTVLSDLCPLEDDGPQTKEATLAVSGAGTRIGLVHGERGTYERPWDITHLTHFYDITGHPRDAAAEIPAEDLSNYGQDFRRSASHVLGHPDSADRLVATELTTADVVLYGMAGGAYNPVANKEPFIDEAREGDRKDWRAGALDVKQGTFCAALYADQQARDIVGIFWHTLPTIKDERLDARYRWDFTGDQDSPVADLALAADAQRAYVARGDDVGSVTIVETPSAGTGAERTAVIGQKILSSRGADQRTLVVGAELLCVAHELNAQAEQVSIYTLAEDPQAPRRLAGLALPKGSAPHLLWSETTGQLYVAHAPDPDAQGARLSVFDLSRPDMPRRIATPTTEEVRGLAFAPAPPQGE